MTTRGEQYLSNVEAHVRTLVQSIGSIHQLESARPELLGTREISRAHCQFGTDGSPCELRSYVVRRAVRLRRLDPFGRFGVASLPVQRVCEIGGAIRQLRALPVLVEPGRAQPVDLLCRLVIADQCLHLSGDVVARSGSDERLAQVGVDPPRIRNGLGITIVSTPRGVLSDAEARDQNVGGEVLAEVF